jgi:hypothetical protein
VILLKKVRKVKGAIQMESAFLISNEFNSDNEEEFEDKDFGGEKE